MFANLEKQKTWNHTKTREFYKNFIFIKTINKHKFSPKKTHNCSTYRGFQRLKN